jgi:hypothetical protein
LASHTTEASHPVTRREIVAAVHAAFTGAPASTESLLRAAHAADARLQTIAVLERLPATHFRSVRDLWTHFPDVPVA